VYLVVYFDLNRPNVDISLMATYCMNPFACFDMFLAFQACLASATWLQGSHNFSFWTWKWSLANGDAWNGLDGLEGIFLGSRRHCSPLPACVPFSVQWCSASWLMRLSRVSFTLYMRRKKESMMVMLFVRRD
jgi:hypothetical protein